MLIPCICRAPTTVILLLVAASAFGQETSALDLAECIGIDDDDTRLRCYDSVSRRPSQQAQEQSRETIPELRYRWEQQLLTDATRKTFTLRPYEPTYVLVTHLSSLNQTPYRTLDPEDQLSRNEVKLAFSLQTKLVDDLFDDDGDIWISYTQTSYWQVFSSDLSSPFRETNYNPEARLAFLTNWELSGVTLRGVHFGIRHDSNGQAVTLSRSWNRVFANFQLTRGSLILEIRPWVRVFSIDDNPDIEDYYGDFDVRAAWERGEQLFAVNLSNPLDSRYGLELNWSRPISGRLRGVVQWYYGYGENLIDYNHRNNRISIGMLLTDWM